MTHVTGSADDPEDLLDKWKTFLTTTTGLYTHLETYAGANEKRSTFTRGGKYYNCYAKTSGAKDLFYVSLATGYTPSVESNLQPNESNWARTNLPTFPYSGYDFFSYANSAHAVVQYAGGKYRHFGLGEIITDGSYVGGEFAEGTYWSQNVGDILYPYNLGHTYPFDGQVGTNYGVNGGHSVVRGDYPGASTPQWRYFSRNSTLTQYARGTTRDGFSGDSHSTTYGPMRDSANNFNGRTVFLPIYCFCYDGTSKWHPLGYVDNVRTAEMTNHSPGDTVVIAGDNWKVFPISQKNGAAGQENSGTYGMAYKVVV